ncbi:MAG: hypothetical protein JXR40_02075 [Pontiellaceae bacterium]|nr:hypothetical protein [Pontiellaceae bacterium]
MKARYASIFMFALLLAGCSLITIHNPFVDIDKLGVVLKNPDDSIFLTSKVGLIKIKHSAPTKRLFILNGESREFDLLKSSEINGIYSGGVIKFKGGPIGGVSGISYTESTAIFSSKEEYGKHIDTLVDGLGFENRTNENIIVNCTISEGSSKYAYIGIERYIFSY